MGADSQGVGQYAQAEGTSKYFSFREIGKCDASHGVLPVNGPARLVGIHAYWRFIAKLSSNSTM